MQRIAQGESVRARRRGLARVELHWSSGPPGRWWQLLARKIIEGANHAGAAARLRPDRVQRRRELRVLPQPGAQRTLEDPGPLERYIIRGAGGARGQELRLRAVLASPVASEPVAHAPAPVPKACSYAALLIGPCVRRPCSANAAASSGEGSPNARLRSKAHDCDSERFTAPCTAALSGSEPRWRSVPTVTA